MTKDLYKIIALELQQNKLEPSLWTQAFAESHGDKERAKASYIRMRFAELETAKQQKQEFQLQEASQTIDVDPASREVRQLRRDLGTLFAAAGKASFYSALSLSPDCSDADLSKTIAMLKEKEAGGVVLASEIKYALDGLRTPEQRLTYDQRMYAALSNSGQGREFATADRYAAEAHPFLSWWATRKLSALLLGIGVIASSYLSLGFFKEKNGKDVASSAVANQGEAIKVVKDHLDAKDDVDRMRAENQAKAIERASEIKSRELALREKALDQQMDLQRARIENQQKQEELRRQQMDRRNVATSTSGAVIIDTSSSSSSRSRYR